ncbi:MAG TPA: PilZ domain-containing protein [Kofleriaceae bacterium]|nr:PilZ domain-containing protein [Kofleriaceae bacterium]
MVKIDLKLGDKSDWVKVFDPRDFSVFVERSDPPDVGEIARIDLTLGGGGPRVILRGRVIARSPGGGELAPGCHVALGPVEREKVNYLNGFVRGGLLDLRERRRVPVRLSVTYKNGAGEITAFTRDINEEGVFVITEDPLPEHTELELGVRFPGRDEIVSVRGHVSHTVVVEDEDVPGMGIRLIATEQQRAELSDLVDKLEADFVAGTLPEEALL